VGSQPEILNRFTLFFFFEGKRGQEKGDRPEYQETLTFKEIAELAFKVLNKKAKRSTLPKWMIRVILPVLRTFTSSKTYGPVEFMMSVMTMDVVGKHYGKERLKDFYEKNV
jgi:hypothetical protein